MEVSLNKRSILLAIAEEDVFFQICSSLYFEDLINLNFACKSLFHNETIYETFKIHCLNKWKLDIEYLPHLSHISHDISFRDLYQFCWPLCENLVSNDNQVVTVTKDNSIIFSGTVGEGNRSVEANYHYPPIHGLSLSPFLQKICGFLFRLDDNIHYNHSNIFSTPFIDGNTNQLYIKPRNVAYYEIKISRGSGKVSSSSNLALLNFSANTIRSRFSSMTSSSSSSSMTSSSSSSSLSLSANSSNSSIASLSTGSNNLSTLSVSTTTTTTTTRTRLQDCVAIGLATNKFVPSMRLPGWDPYSFGYHSDDGAIFHGRGRQLAAYGPCFGIGDVVGCGVNYSERSLFFTLNGEFLGNAFVNLPIADNFRPTVGIDAKVNIDVNFGMASPFLFPLVSYLNGEIDINKQQIQPIVLAS